MTAYLDTSAAVKLGIVEAESGALLAAITAHEHLAVSVVGRVEIERAVRRRAPVHADRVLANLMRQFSIIPLHAAIAAIAAALRPVGLRSLDAIHLATVMALGDDLDAFYCYDERLAAAAAEHGIAALAPT